MQRLGEKRGGESYKNHYRGYDEFPKLASLLNKKRKTYESGGDDKREMILCP